VDNEELTSFQIVDEAEDKTKVVLLLAKQSGG